MNSTLNPQTSTADDVLAARADERLTHAYEQITRADEQLARVTEQLSRLERGGARHPSVVPGLQSSRGRPLLRGLAGLVLAAGICAAAFAAQSPYGEPARLMIAQWAPGLFPTSLMQSGTPEAPAQPIRASVQLAAAEATPSQAVPSLQPAQDPAPTPAPLPAELTQLLQSMAHDIAVVEQEIEQLKASQEQMFAENAKAIEQVRASQEQLTRLAEKPSERDLRAKTPAAPPRPANIANAARKPPPTQTPQARARPQPIQLQPDEQ
jgi:hypothetical protein